MLVIPSSFRAGPLYDRMREFVRSKGEILTIASIQDRNGVFVDVAQDISVLVARKGEPHSAGSKVRFPVIGSVLSAKSVVEETLSEAAGAAWPFPAADPKAVGGATLKDYGVESEGGLLRMEPRGSSDAEDARQSDSVPSNLGEECPTGQAL